MKNILETKRLLLREFQVNDAQKMYELNTNLEVIKYTGDSSFKSIQQAKIFLKNYTDYKKNGYGRWAVVLKESGEFIGWCGLKLNEENFTDIGFRFFKREWNNGFATESSNAVLAYGFDKLGLTEIIGRSAIENSASIIILKKLNMTFWKVDTCEGIENSVYYRINNKQFNDKRRQ